MPKVLVVRADPYNIEPDEDNPKGNKGISLWFLGANNDPGQNNGFGHKPMKMGLPENLLPAVQNKLPAICDIDFELKAAAGNKASAVITALTVLSPFNLSQLLTGKPA